MLWLLLPTWTYLEAKRHRGGQIEHGIRYIGQIIAEVIDRRFKPRTVQRMERGPAELQTPLHATCFFKPLPPIPIGVTDRDNPSLSAGLLSFPALAKCGEPIPLDEHIFCALDSKWNGQVYLCDSSRESLHSARLIHYSAVIGTTERWVVLGSSFR